MPDYDRNALLSSVLLALLTGLGASFLFALLAMALAPSAHAESLVSQPAPEHSGAMHVRTLSGRVIRNIPRLRTDVQMQVNGLVARVRVKQRFQNPSPEWVEAVYAFPLPQDSAVDHLRMVVGERVIEGQIKPRAEARKVYREARAVGKRASLLEQQRPNLFTSSVANIPPGEEILVEIEYQQAVQYRDATFSLRFPMVVGPRYIPGTPIQEQVDDFDAHGWAQPTDVVPDAAHITPPVAAEPQAASNPVSMLIELDAGLPLQSVKSLYHPLRSEQISAMQRRLSLRDQVVPADRDFVLEWQVRAQSVPQAALFSETHADKHYQMLMVVPPDAADLDAAMLPARELILVVDTSGSMYGDSIVQARAALQLALQQLRPQDRFNIIAFNDQTHQLFEAPVNADPDALQRARDYVDGLSADGGTEMLPAMRAALGQPARDPLLRQVVFLTDGDIGNEQQLFDEITAGLGDARLFPVGIGSAPNSYFMTRAAAFGRGSYTFIGDLAEVGERMGALFRRLSYPVLTQLQVQWKGAQHLRQAPARLPDLYAGEPLSISTQSATPIASALITGMLGNRPWQRKLTLQGGAKAAGVRVIWARRMIADAMARRALSDDVDSIKQEIVSLAMTHHLVSAYTSLVAVEQTPARPLDEALHSKPLPTRLPKGWGKPQALAMMPQTATPAPLYLLLGVTLLLASSGLWGWSQWRQRA